MSALVYTLYYRLNNRASRWGSVKGDWTRNVRGRCARRRRLVSGLWRRSALIESRDVDLHTILVLPMYRARNSLSCVLTTVFPDMRCKLRRGERGEMEWGEKNLSIFGGIEFDLGWILCGKLLERVGNCLKLFSVGKYLRNFERISKLYKDGEKFPRFDSTDVLSVNTYGRIYSTPRWWHMRANRVRVPGNFVELAELLVCISIHRTIPRSPLAHIIAYLPFHTLFPLLRCVVPVSADLRPPSRTFLLSHTPSDYLPHTESTDTEPT